MKEHFERMLAYNQWANSRVLDSLAEQRAPAEIMDLFCHILRAELIWAARAAGDTFDGGAFGGVPEPEMREWIRYSESAWGHIIGSKAPYLERVSYTMLDGTAAETGLHDILTHVFSHGTYHRGQVASKMRQAGLQPVATDYIRFSRLQGG